MIADEFGSGLNAGKGVLRGRHLSGSVSRGPNAFVLFSINSICCFLISAFSVRTPLYALVA